MLNHAAALETVALSFVSLFVLSLFAGAAHSLDSIDLSVAPEPAAEGECSRLVQIKYPFLSCTNGEIGLRDGDATWDNSRHLPMQTDWTEGDSYFGPALNQSMMEF